MSLRNLNLTVALSLPLTVACGTTDPAGTANDGESGMTDTGDAGTGDSDGGTNDGESGTNTDSTGDGDGDTATGDGDGSTGDGDGSTGDGDGDGTRCEAAIEAANSMNVTYWTTLDDLGAVNGPMVGDGTGSVVSTMPADDFVAGLTNDGLQIDADFEYLQISQTGLSGDHISLQAGAIDFCFRPSFDSVDDVDHALFFAQSRTLAGGVASIRMRKASTNNNDNIQFMAIDQDSMGNATIHEVNIPPSVFSFVADEWHRVTATWNYTASPAEVHVYIDGNEVVDPNAPSSAMVMPASPNPGDLMYVGAFDASPTGNGWNAGGVIDEFVIHSRPFVP